MKAIKIEKNYNEIQNALNAVNGKSQAHTFSSVDIFELVCRLDGELARLGIPKTKRSGAKIVARSGEKLPSAYKYSRTVNWVTIELKKSGFFLSEIRCATAYREFVPASIYLTDTQDEIAKKTAITWMVTKSG